ncbi:hypothetical protein J1605_022416 [Eschrichtius robustus]|uniref:Uncharacterized protein n=1 Tax=Eschrichtius robustus TaxID=9764 RepID=A0AB34HA87_ESCRO|nr:hypothetical protein J1605_022416 [Eschrichtius robustus]
MSELLTRAEERVLVRPHEPPPPPPVHGAGDAKPIPTCIRFDRKSSSVTSYREDTCVCERHPPTSSTTSSICLVNFFIKSFNDFDSPPTSTSPTSTSNHCFASSSSTTASSSSSDCPWSSSPSSSSNCTSSSTALSTVFCILVYNEWFGFTISGIQLRKVEEQREQEAKHERIENDVATILSRRIAVEYSDSEDDSEFDEVDWLE